MADITYFLTDSSHIDDITVAVGNLLFCEDTKTVYLDGNNGRVAYDSISVFENDAQRENYINPYIGFYYVEETKILWRYDGRNWIAITEPPSTNVVFIPYNNLPTQGESEVIYVCGQEVYIWDAIKNNYVPINADSIWHEI